LTIDMTLVMEQNEHLGEDQLESYSIGNLAEPDAVCLEEHVLICEACQDRLAASDSWVRFIRRAALKRIQLPERAWAAWSLPRLVPVLAALILIVAAAVALRITRQSAVAPLAVALEATRGPAVSARVPALRPLMLEPGLEGLRPLDRYHLEIVDLLGNEMWRADYAPVPGGASGVFMPGLSPGTYFVRLYDESRVLLREFALEARNSH
jgi:hypothetical protein